MKLPQRVRKVPPYLFAELDKVLQVRRDAGIKLTSLAIGDPDQPTPAPIIEALKQAADNPANHRYPPYPGLKPLRVKIAEFMKKRFGVTLDPDKEILVLIGSKEGIGHAVWGLVEAGDTVLIPDPGYPSYSAVTTFAEADAHFMPLHEESGYLPDFAEIPKDVLGRARLMILNYPNNPTGALAPLSFHQKAVEFAKAHDIGIMHDNAYSEVYYESPSPSILQVPGAMDCAIEMHSFSKTFNMTGWRLGWACGNAEMIKALYVIKTNLDSSVFNAVQLAGIRGLELVDSIAPEIRDRYRKRRDVAYRKMQAIGFKPYLPGGAFYLWSRLPKGWTDSMKFVIDMVDRAHVVFSPGVGYGPNGEGYFRLALTQNEDVIESALSAVAKAL